MFTNQSVQLNHRLCGVIRNLKKLNLYDQSHGNVRTLKSWLPSSSTLLAQLANIQQYQHIRGKKDDTNLSALFKPVPVKSNPDDISVGAELTGKLDKGELLKVLNKFTQKKETKILCLENGLDSKLKYFF